MTMPSESTYVRVLNGYDAGLFVHTPPQPEMRVAEEMGLVLPELCTALSEPMGGRVANHLGTS